MLWLLWGFKECTRFVRAEFDVPNADDEPEDEDVE
jgi:hypothetical protein